MSHRFHDLTFTPLVKAQQQQHNSRRQYERMEHGSATANALGPDEQAFLARRDSFYMASVSETGWPYVQHRGGPVGFVHVFNPSLLGFADLRGNKQYISLGNFDHDPRVALFFMDYPNQTRLKLLGRAEVHENDAEAAALLSTLGTGDPKIVAERAILIHLDAFDWNCPQYISPRYTTPEIESALTPLHQRLTALEDENASLRAQLASPQHSLRPLLLSHTRPTPRQILAPHHAPGEPMIPVKGYAAKHSFSSLKPFEFERDDAKPNEVVIDVLFCGVCHSDIHQVKNEWSNTVYPCVPGHEAVGRVSAIGSGVTRHAVGDLVGVGCMIDSCRSCEPCKEGDENYCEGPNSWLATYNGPMIPAKQAPTGKNSYGRDNTFGGYSTSLVVPEDFVLKIPAALKPEVAAPILCAGVTTFSPLTHWGVKSGDKVGILGFGGLGDMAAKLAKAMGAEVVIFTSTKEKVAEAAKLGATGVYEKDEDALKQHKGSFDFILSTIPEKHDLNPFIPLLKRNKTIVAVGALEPMAPVNNQQVAFHRNTVGGSLIGSIKETQAVLDFCAEHKIGPDIEVIDIKDINDAYSKVEDGEVRFRYVIDMATLKQAAA